MEKSAQCLRVEITIRDLALLKGMNPILYFYFRRVQGPVYGERKALRKAVQARERIEKYRADQFD